MSQTANWSYTNVATVWPLLTELVDDGWGPSIQPTYGEPYEIMCTWEGGGDLVQGNDGQAFAPAMQFYHEDSRVKFGDLICKGVETDQLNADQIRAHKEYDMSFFGELRDFLSVVGYGNQRVS